MTETDREIYTRQGLGRRAGMGVAPALVIVDYVVGFADPT